VKKQVVSGSGTGSGLKLKVRIRIRPKRSATTLVIGWERGSTILADTAALNSFLERTKVKKKRQQAQQKQRLFRVHKTKKTTLPPLKVLLYEKER